MLNKNNDKYLETFKTWNIVAKLYEDIFMDLDIYNESYNLFCDLLINESSAVLEIGCGPGNISKYILSKLPNLNYLGIDIAPKMIELARKNNPSALFNVMDVRTINELSQNFDAIICGFILPYMSQGDVRQLMLDCKKVLNNKGVFYLSFVDGDYSKSNFQTGSKGDRVYFYYHSIENIKSELITNGFKILNTLNVDYIKGEETEIHTILVAQIIH